MNGEAGISGLTAERVQSLNEDDLQALCECVDASILEGGGFAWVRPQGRSVLERYFRGILLVPERLLFVARQDGILVGSAQLARPSRSNDAQAMYSSVTHSHISPSPRGTSPRPVLHTDLISGAHTLWHLSPTPELR